jgi:hypothetical protein
MGIVGAGTRLPLQSPATGLCAYTGSLARRFSEPSSHLYHQSTYPARSKLGGKTDPLSDDYLNAQQAGVLWRKAISACSLYRNNPP